MCKLIIFLKMSKAVRQIVRFFKRVRNRISSYYNLLRLKMYGVQCGRHCVIHGKLYVPLNPQLHSRSATYIKRNGLLIRKTAIKSSHPFQYAYHPLTP